MSFNSSTTEPDQDILHAAFFFFFFFFLQLAGCSDQALFLFELFTDACYLHASVPAFWTEKKIMNIIIAPKLSQCTSLKTQSIFRRFGLMLRPSSGSVIQNSTKNDTW